MNRRGFLTGLLASTALARAPARIPMVSLEAPAPVYLAISPSLGELLLANAQEAMLVKRSSLVEFDGELLELLEGRLGTIKGFEFIS